MENLATGRIAMGILPLEVFSPIITEAIITNRDIKIANEIRKLRKQVWQ